VPTLAQTTLPGNAASARNRKGALVKHVKPPKQKSWIVVRYPANDKSAAIYDGYYNDREEALDVIQDLEVQYPQWVIKLICNDGTLGYPPPDWEPDPCDGFDELIARGNAALQRARERRQKRTPEQQKEEDEKSAWAGRIAEQLERYEEQLSELQRVAEQEEREEQERQRKQQQQASGLGEWDAGDDVELPPPRAWLLGNVFCRSFVSSLFGDGGTGKTSVRYAQLLSLAIGRSLTGEYVFQRCRVLIVSLEDDKAELRRRIRALCLHYKIDRAELKGWLFLSAPGGPKAGKLLSSDLRGRLVVGTLVAKLEAVILTREIDIVAIDPFVKSHAVEENANSAIDMVVQVLSDMAARYNIAVDAPHHMSKGQAEPGNANRGRGASALKDGARLVYTLTTMTPEEAVKFRIGEDDRRQFIRMDHGKVNLVPQRAMKWFHLVGVPLGNATDLYPHGDEVQVVEPWEPPSTWKEFSDELTELILAEIDAGLPDGTRYSDAPNAKERAAYKVVQKHIPDKSDQQAREIIKTWVSEGKLERRKYDNVQERKSVLGLWASRAKTAPPQDQELPF
jgi:hypothetical protein